MSKFCIPNPCFENWEAMLPENCGRKCAACNKVVHDFSASNEHEIENAISSSSSQICGRFPSNLVEKGELQGYAFHTFPMQRLRLFIIAFVCAFGLEVWACSDIMAQVNEAGISNLKDSIATEVLVANESDSVHVKGEVLDIYDFSPVLGVQVTILQNGNSIFQTFTNLDGQFEVSIPKSIFDSENYDLELSYLGRSRINEGIRLDVEYVSYLIDAGIQLPSVSITENRNILQGVVIEMGMLTMRFSFETKTLYRPLDEWLMMNFSEIHLSKRW